jgi:hypothetical protein
MNRKRRQGGWSNALDAACSAKGRGAGSLQALAHFGGKPIHRIEIERFSDARFLFTLQKAPLGFLASQIRRVKRLGFQLRAYGRGNFPQPRKGRFDPFHRCAGQSKDLED